MQTKTKRKKYLTKKRKIQNTYRFWLFAITFIAFGSISYHAYLVNAEMYVPDYKQYIVVNRVDKKLSTVKDLISYYAMLYNVDERQALDIAYCESRFNPLAKNPNSSAKGVYQFIDKTWKNYCYGDVFDPEANIKCFMKLYKQHPDWWACKAN